MDHLSYHRRKNSIRWWIKYFSGFWYSDPVAIIYDLEGSWKWFKWFPDCNETLLRVAREVGICETAKCISEEGLATHALEIMIYMYRYIIAQHITYIFYEEKQFIKKVFYV